MKNLIAICVLFFAAFTMTSAQEYDITETTALMSQGRHSAFQLTFEEADLKICSFAGENLNKTGNTRRRETRLPNLLFSRKWRNLRI